MEAQLIDIYCKQSDYKVCKKCKRLNWYENESCVNTDCCSNSFTDKDIDIEEAFAKEWTFWIDEEGYTEKEADRVRVEV